MKVGASLVHRQKFGKVDWVFGSTGYLNYSHIKNARDNKLRFTNKLRYRITDSLSVGMYSNVNIGNSNTVFLWQLQDEDTGEQVPIPNYIGDPGNMTSSKVLRFNIDPFVNYFDKRGGRHKYNGRYFRVRNENANDQGNFSDLFYNEYQYQRNIEAIDMVATAGIVSTNTVVEGALYGDTTFVANNVAAYLQLDKKFYFNKDDDSKNVLNVSGGFRYEFNRLTGPKIIEKDFDDNGDYIPGSGIILEEQTAQESKPVFRLGLNYKPAEFTYIRASFGQGYRYPSVAEKYITTTVAGLPIFSNPNLESETGWSAELGIKQGYRIGGKFEGFVDVSGFLSQYQNMMEFNLSTEPGKFGFQSQNVGNTQILGFETSIAGRTSDARFPTQMLLGYTYIDPKFQEFEDIDESVPTNPADLTEGQLNDWNSTADENILKYRSRHSLKFDIETKFKMITLGINMVGNSKIVAIDRLLDQLTYRGDYVGNYDVGYLVFGARAAYHITDQVRLSLVGKNLLNTEYSARPGQLEPPMSWSLRLDAKF